MYEIFRQKKSIFQIDIDYDMTLLLWTLLPPSCPVVSSLGQLGLPGVSSYLYLTLNDLHTDPPRMIPASKPELVIANNIIPVVIDQASAEAEP